MKLFINKNGQQLGPYPLEEVNRQIKAGLITLSDLGWREGMPAWLPLSSIQGVEEKRVTQSPPDLPNQSQNLTLNNPYAPPQSFLQGEAVAGSQSMRATKTQRFLNWVIDGVAIYVSAMILFVFLAFTVGFLNGFSGSSILDFDQMNDESAAVMGQILFLISFFAYYTISEGAFGKTVGKMLTKTKVVTEDGESPSYAVAAKRSLCRLIPFEPFSFLGRNVSGWHDSITKTRVVKDRGNDLTS